MVFLLSSADLTLDHSLVVLQPPAVVSFFARRLLGAAAGIRASIPLFQMSICSEPLPNVYSCVQLFEAHVSVLLKWFVLFNINIAQPYASLKSAYLCCYDVILASRL